MKSAKLLSKAGDVLAYLQIEQIENGAFGGDWERVGDLREIVKLSERYSNELNDNLLGHASETMNKIVNMRLQICVEDGSVISPRLVMVLSQGKIWFRPEILRNDNDGNNSN